MSEVLSSGSEWTMELSEVLSSGSELGCPNFALKKGFASKQNLAKQKQFRFVLLQLRETTKKSFASFGFVSLRKFGFVLLKKRFASVVSPKKSFTSI